MKASKMNRKDDLDILARTIFGEARGETRTGKEAVAAVVINRIKSNKKHLIGYISVGKAQLANIAETCLKPYQFSCWLKNDPNRPLLEKVTLDNAVFRECFEIADLAIKGQLEDMTEGATHYFNPKACKMPKWAVGKKPLYVCGHHLFYRILD